MVLLVSPPLGDQRPSGKHHRGDQESRSSLFDIRIDSPSERTASLSSLNASRSTLSLPVATSSLRCSLRWANWTKRFASRVFYSNFHFSAANPGNTPITTSTSVSPILSSSRLHGLDILYINDQIDRLLHLSSLYLSNPAEIGAQIADQAAHCENPNFFCRLCQFTANITQSCKEWAFFEAMSGSNTACLEATQASLRAFLPGAAFALQRDVLYRLDVLSALLSATLTHSPAQLEALRLENARRSLLDALVETLARHLRAVEVAGSSV